ncbi:MAG: hypothetical protein M1817_003671 [Caeruleum heppii]|nr:MAG: hypothetical protein M1817_003671 [Caeruleum heppii]
MSVVSKILTGAISVVASLSQADTNGVSQYGTLEAPTYPEYLTDNPLPDGFPWGARTAEGTNAYKESPLTGKTRYYDFTVKRAKLAPDGYQKDVIVINGQYPGPTIEANWGDWIEVKVRNQIAGPEEGTSFHWHGLLQTLTPWFDGIPSVTQCPIAPNATFTYRFKADLYGTSWYHSHYSSQYAGGLHGPMIIHGPRHARYDIDLGAVFINDWYHREYFDIVKDVMGTDLTKNPPFSDNNLINGKMNFDCSTVNDGVPCNSNAGLARFRFRTGKTHRLRLINSGAEALERFSIDNHTMTVIANDFVPVRPYDTNVVTLGIGQRTDVLVKANGKPTDAVWMRANMSAACSVTRQPNALALVYYDRADTRKKPETSAWPAPNDICENDPLEKTVPLFPIRPNPSPATTETITLTAGLNASGNFLWYMNGVSHRGNLNNPLLLLAHQKNLSYPYNPEWNVYNFGSNRTMRIIFNNDFPVSHPMHMHGHNMYILSVGPGRWDGQTIQRPNNPQRRDVQMVPGNGHMVWQLDADNPGVWPFHCHIAWHVSGGLYVNFIERPNDIRQMQIPQIMAQTCRDWEAYTNSTTVLQIDSGV